MRHDTLEVAPDLRAAAAFLQWLDPQAFHWTFQTFDDNKDRGDKSLARTLHGTLDDCGAELIRLNRRGAGVFITINETDGTGREARNIIRVRAHFLDMDGAPIEPVLAWEPPHRLISTSPGKWQVYWHVSDAGLADFPPVQTELAAAFGGDNVKDLPRVLRLPGFFHQKVDSKKSLTGAPYLVREVPVDPAAFPAPFTAAQFRDRLASIRPRPTRHPLIDLSRAEPVSPPPANTPRMAEVEEALAHIPCGALSYGEWFAVLAALHDAFGDGGQGMAERWSANDAQRFRPGEVAHKWRGIGRYTGKRATVATIMHLARQNGCDLRELARKHMPDRPEGAGRIDHGDKAERQEQASGQPPAEAPAATIRPTPFTLRPSHEIPPRQWLYGRHLIRGFVSLTVAPGGVGKSSMVLADALALATGRDLLGAKPPTPARVWVWNGEDPREEIERRIAAACLHYRISADDLGDRLLVDSGRDLPIVMATMAGGAVTVAKPVAAQIKDAIRAAQIDALIVDPFVTSHEVSENDNTAVNAVAKEWRQIADETGCAIELVHHTSKAGAGDGDGLGIYATRGAGALIDAVRAARYLVRMTQQEADRFGIEETEARVTFRVCDGKGNLAPPEKATWRQMASVSLGNGGGYWPEGDRVGVCTIWTPPDAFEGLTARDLIRVQEAIAAETDPPRESDKSPQWVGFTVGDALGLDLGGRDSTLRQRAPGQNGARARVRTMLREWIRSGALAVESIKDAKSNERKIVTVGEPVRPDEV